MRSLLALLLLSTTSRAQPQLPTNSFQAHYAQTPIHYRYDAARQWHDYAGNWDLDQDGTPDGVYFVGTGGAHLYYFLRVVLSRDGRTRDFPALSTDMPLLPAGYDPRRAEAPFQPEKTFFTVFRATPRGRPTLFLCLDQASYAEAAPGLRRQGVRGNLVAVSFPGGRPLVQDVAVARAGQ